MDDTQTAAAQLDDALSAVFGASVPGDETLRSYVHGQVTGSDPRTDPAVVASIVASSRAATPTGDRRQHVIAALWPVAFDSTHVHSADAQAALSELHVDACGARREYAAQHGLSPLTAAARREATLGAYRVRQERSVLGSPDMPQRASGRAGTRTAWGVTDRAAAWRQQRIGRRRGATPTALGGAGTGQGA